MGVMHTLRDLEMICQKPHWRERGSLLARRFARPAALYITWLLSRWPISANVITGATLIVGWAAAAILATPGFFITGVAALWVWYLLDHVDGQVARLRKSESVTGVYFDFMMHHFVHPAVAFGLGYGIAQRTGDLRWSLAGAGFAFGTMALSVANDCRYKAFFAALRCSSRRSEYATTVPEASANSTLGCSTDGRTCAPYEFRKGRVAGLARAGHRLLLKACEIPSIILLLTAIALCSMADADFGNLVVGIYVFAMALLVPTLAVLRLAKQVWNQLPDRDYRATSLLADPRR